MQPLDWTQALGKLTAGCEALLCQPLDWTQALGKLTAGCEALLCNPWIGLRLLENLPLDVRLCYATLGLGSGSWKTHRWM